MAKLSFTKDQLLNDLRSFITDPLNTLLQTWFHPARVNHLLDLEKHPSFDYFGEKHSQFLMENYFSDLYDYAETGTLNPNIGEELDLLAYIAGEEISNFEHFLENCHGGISYNGTPISDKTTEIMEVCAAREIMTPLAWSELTESENELTIEREALAALAEVSEETIRQAHYLEGEDCLTPCEKSNTSYKVEEAIRWLKRKGKFTPSRYKELKEYDFNPNLEFQSSMVFSNWVRHACGYKKIPLDSLAKKLGIEFQKKEVNEFLDQHSQFFSEENYSDYLPMEWLTTKVSIKLAELLEVNPKWMINTVYTIKKNQEKQSLEKALEDLPATITQPRTVIHDETAITAELAKQELKYCEWVNAHPQQTKPNKKMDGYITNDNVTFTHQHDGKAQIIWLPMEYKSSITVDCKITDYPASDIQPGGRYNRHSGLKKYLPLAEADLIKVTLKDIGSFRKVLETLR